MQTGQNPNSPTHNWPKPKTGSILTLAQFQNWLDSVTGPIPNLANFITGPIPIGIYKNKVNTFFKGIGLSLG